MNEVILALDFGLQTGWAVRRDNGTIVSGSICLGNGWKKDYGRYGHRFQRFRDLLNEQKAQNPEISEVVYEDPISHKGAAQARSYGGYLAHLGAMVRSGRYTLPPDPRKNPQKTVHRQR